MAAQGTDSNAPRRLWPRLRLRTLLAGVAAVALLIIVVPWGLWRYRVNRALEAARAAGPEMTWSFNPLGAPRREEFLYLLSDRDRVLEELLRTVEDDPDDLRRVHAVRTMQAILRQSCPSAVRRRCLDQTLDLAARGRLSPTVDLELAQAVADWAPVVGLDARQRGAVLAKVKGGRPTPSPAWAGVLARIGGREETLLLIELGDSHNPALLDAVHNSPLMHSLWPGLLPALRRWLDDPVIAPHALKYAQLSMTPDGRDVLLAYATAVEHPAGLRRQALERLRANVAGVNLVLKALEEPAASEALHPGYEGDLRAAFRASLARLEGRNGDALWSELLAGLDTGYPNRFPDPTTATQRAISEAEGRMRQHTRESSLRCLRWITGRADLTSRSEWQRWYEATRPSPLAQRELVELALEHPEALGCAAILRRIVPSHLGEVPADCVPLYERMAREGPPESRYWACRALLLYTPETDVTPDAIDLISQARPDDARPGSGGPIELLRDRFAENFFWDTTAWREWGEEQAREATKRRPDG